MAREKQIPRYARDDRNPESVIPKPLPQDVIPRPVFGRGICLWGCCGGKSEGEGKADSSLPFVTTQDRRSG